MQEAKRERAMSEADVINVQLSMRHVDKIRKSLMANAVATIDDDDIEAAGAFGIAVRHATQKRPTIAEAVCMDQSLN